MKRVIIAAGLIAASVAGAQAATLDTVKQRGTLVCGVCVCTDCGVCFTHGVPDYNGHWGVSELCDICPQTQRALCRDAHQPPTADQLRRILGQLGYDTPALVLADVLITYCPLKFDPVNDDCVCRSARADLRV